MKKIMLFFALATSYFGFAQPANDACSAATVVPVGSDITCTTTPGTFAGATASAVAVSCTENAGKDVWFEFTATNTYHRINFTPLNLPLPYFALYSGTCDNLVEEHCGSYNTNLQNLTIGQTYKLKVYYPVSNNNVNENFSICINTPPPVISINTDFTAEELVNDILINSSCLEVSNITSSSAIDIAQGFHSIGYYDQNGSTFTSGNGIILSTGNVELLPGPTNNHYSSGVAGWGGDTDLQALMSGNGNSGSYSNASSIEFDFVPAIEHISFDFIFASNEYGTFQCNFADAFAFILTDLTTGVTTNLAVVPNTNIPVSVTTIRNSIYNTQCPSANPQYFDQYYGDSPIAPINMLGHTVPLTAQSPVTPGNPYNIKLVIADYNDQAFDSAVFIDAGSFNIGSPEYAEMSFSNGTILCEGETTIISLNLGESFTYTWYYNGDIIPGETGNSLIVSQEGSYTVAVTLPSGCVLEYSASIQAGADLSNPGGISQLQDYIIFEPNSDGLALFDLVSQNEDIIGDADPDDFIISYHSTLVDAQAASAELFDAHVNTANPQTIYVRIANTQSNCYTIKSMRLIVLDENYTTPAPTGNDEQDFAPGATLADIVVEGENIQWYDNPGSASGRNTTDNDDIPLPLTTLLVDGTTYYASQTLYGIESIDRFAVTVHIVTMGLEDNYFVGLQVYPNPVKNVLYINNNEEVENVVIHNLLGQIILDKEVKNTSNEINLSSFNNGVYIVKITSLGTEKIIKIVKE